LRRLFFTARAWAVWQGYCVVFGSLNPLALGDIVLVSEIAGILELA
jgi:hypothetical protein